MWKVAFEIRDNSIQTSSSYAGPSVYSESVNKMLQYGIEKSYFSDGPF